MKKILISNDDGINASVRNLSMVSRSGAISEKSSLYLVYLPSSDFSKKSRAISTRLSFSENVFCHAQNTRSFSITKELFPRISLCLYAVFASKIKTPPFFRNIKTRSMVFLISSAEAR